MRSKRTGWQTLDDTASRGAVRGTVLPSNIPAGAIASSGSIMRTAFSSDARKIVSRSGISVGRQSLGASPISKDTHGTTLHSDARDIATKSGTPAGWQSLDQRLQGHGVGSGQAKQGRCLQRSNCNKDCCSGEPNRQHGSGWQSALGNRRSDFVSIISTLMDASGSQDRIASILALFNAMQQKGTPARVTLGAIARAFVNGGANSKVLHRAIARIRAILFSLDKNGHKGGKWLDLGELPKNYPLDEEPCEDFSDPNCHKGSLGPFDIVISFLLLMTLFYPTYFEFDFDQSDEQSVIFIGGLTCADIQEMTASAFTQHFLNMLDGPTGDDEQKAMTKVLACLPCSELQDFMPNLQMASSEFLSNFDGSNLLVAMTRLEACSLIGLTAFNDDAARAFIDTRTCEELARLSLDDIRALIMALFKGNTDSQDEAAIVSLIECLSPCQFKKLLSMPGMGADHFGDQIDDDDAWSQFSAAYWNANFWCPLG